MSNLVIYSCHCLNIRVHLATKYTLDNLDNYKKDNAVNEPLFGWEFELGMGGLHTEFNFLSSSQQIRPEWDTFKCFNCNTDTIFSIPHTNIPNQLATNKIIIHENAICGKELEQAKQKENYSHTFNVNLNKENIKESIPMPDSTEDVPDNLISSYTQIKSSLEQSVEQLRIESKVRIEQFKKQEEKQLQDQISRAKLENNVLWTQLVNTSKLISNNQSEEEPQESGHHHSSENHVRFAVKDTVQHPAPTTLKRLGFALEESSFTHLKNVNLDNHHEPVGNHTEDDEDYDEEEMFNLDEELSEEEREEDLDDESDSVDKDTQKNDLLLSSSLKKSISEIDQRFSWAKKKKNTNKYLVKGFDVKTELRKDTSDDNNPISLLATSMPISIHYRLANEDVDEKDESSSPNKHDILVSSFANYDLSFSDRMLSGQFPAPPRRKSLVSSSLIRPQLDSLTGKSLDTRGVVRKKTKEVELQQSDEEYDPTVPPHIWAATMDKE